MTKEQPGNGMVQWAYLHHEHPSHSWVESVREMLEYDLEHNRRLARQPINVRAGAGVIAQRRNYATRLFLDKTPHEWLLFIDDDMGFEPDSVDRLLAVADPRTRPVVGALCFALMLGERDGMGGWRHTFVPTMYKIGHAENTGAPSYCHFGDYPVDEVTPVATTGAAFLLIHRSALERVRAKHNRNGDQWFDMMYDQDGDVVGEDFAFCTRLLGLGIIPAVHTGVKTTHHKEIWAGEDDYLAQRATTIELPIDGPLFIDLDASLTALARNEHVRDDMLKFPTDLDRYARIVEATRPEVVVETGTRTGGSARWFAALGLDVITVDVNEVAIGRGYRDRVTQVVGDSADPDVAARVAELVAGRRVMVSLDSDHSAAHVTAEIKLYGPLVSAGCYLVVEDGIFGYAPGPLRAQHGLGNMVGSPLEAIVAELVDDPGWSRDVAIERAHAVSANPAGWWVRNG